MKRNRKFKVVLTEERTIQLQGVDVTFPATSIIIKGLRKDLQQAKIEVCKKLDEYKAREGKALTNLSTDMINKLANKYANPYQYYNAVFNMLYDFLLDYINGKTTTKIPTLKQDWNINTTETVQLYKGCLYIKGFDQLNNLSLVLQLPDDESLPQKAVINSSSVHIYLEGDDMYVEFVYEPVIIGDEFLNSLEEVNTENTKRLTYSGKLLPDVTPDVVTPDVVTLEDVTPDVVTPDVVTPDVVTLEDVTPDVVTLEDVTPDVVTLEDVTPDVVTPDVVTPDDVTLDVVTPDDVTLEEKYKILKAQGMNNTQIAKELGVARRTIIRWNKKYNFK